MLRVLTFGGFLLFIGVLVICDGVPCFGVCLVCDSLRLGFCMLANFGFLVLPLHLCFGWVYRLMSSFVCLWVLDLFCGFCVRIGVWVVIFVGFLWLVLF